MKINIRQIIKLFFSGCVILLMTISLFGCGASITYHDNPVRMNLDREGPYAFYKNDSVLNINYIRGDRHNGFFIEQTEFSADSSIKASCYFPLDSTFIEFEVLNNFKTPSTSYNDNNPILAISDIESGYKTFRDFLINSEVIDEDLNWTFGSGHLVLVGDFIDRGSSATQVLWFIYRLEQEAKKYGGNVHYILGNHELKNFQGLHGAAESKYYGVAAILDKQHSELYNSSSFLGRWMASKNTIEIINGQLFAHRGLHPDVANSDLSLTEINQVIREEYYNVFYPKAAKSDEELFISSRTGIAWYRGYFRSNLTQEQVEKALNKFDAKSIIVGHTLQSKVNRQYNGKVIGIDVRHPKDYRKNWPNKKSQGLMILDNKYYKVSDKGELKEI